MRGFSPDTLMLYNFELITGMLKDKIVIVDVTKKQKLVSEVNPLSSRSFTMTKSNS